MHITRSTWEDDATGHGTRKGRQKKRWEDKNQNGQDSGWVKPFERLRIERNGEK